jgi:hypothetical protein
MGKKAKELKNDYSLIRQLTKINTPTIRQGDERNLFQKSSKRIIYTDQQG